MDQLAFLASFHPDFQKAITEAISDPMRDKIACFDGDGTLWSYDIGEAFFRFLIAGRLLKGVDYQRPLYEEYEERVQRNRTDGYASIVAMMAGLQEKDVIQWAEQIAYVWPSYRKEMISLVQGLKSCGFDVWVVSASNKWVVIPAVRRFGIDENHVIAIESEVKDGILTDKVIEPIPCEKGKVEAIKQRIRRQPLLACGDSMGDYEMLCYAKIAVVVSNKDRITDEMIKKVEEYKWACHLF